MMIVYVPNRMDVVSNLEALNGDDRGLVRYLAELSVEPRSVEMYDTQNVAHMRQFVVNNNMGFHSDKLALTIERDIDELRTLIAEVRGESEPMQLTEGESECESEECEDDDWGE